MFLTILVFIIVLSILVFVHEAGHFFVAKFLGIRVEEFGFGLPPRAFGIKRGETIYSINWLPIGGFVRLAGEDQLENRPSGFTQKNAKHLFWARSKKERAAVLLAGVTMNFLLAAAILTYIFIQGVFVPTGIRIVEVTADSPAAEAGIQPEDVVTAVDDVSVLTSSEFVPLIKEKEGTTVTLTITRDDTEVKIPVTPRTEYAANEGALGIRITESGAVRKYPWYQAPFVGLLEATKTTIAMIGVLGTVIWRLISFQGLEGLNVGGPVAIAQATGSALQFGFRGVLDLMGLLSLNLAIINVLPIPALDGGRLLFIVLEKFIGRKVQPRAEAMAHQIGMVFLLTFIVLITINDILRIVRK